MTKSKTYHRYMALALTERHLEKEYALLCKLSEFTHNDVREYKGFKRYQYLTPVGWRTSKTKLSALNNDALDFYSLE